MTHSRQCGDAPSVLVLPIKIGDVTATTVQMSLSEVLFDAAASFAVATSIDFMVVIGRAESAVSVGCRGAVVSCVANADGRFRTAARIDEFQILREVQCEADTRSAKRERAS